MMAKTLRQSVVSIKAAAKGDIVTGASPIPAETSDTAKARRVVNQPVTTAIIDAKKAAAAPPASSPKIS